MKKRLQFIRNYFILIFKIIFNIKMGNCCDRMENIDHVKTLEDLKIVVQLDIDMIQQQFDVIRTDVRFIFTFRKYKIINKKN
jgi:hypothetical protein